MNCQAISHRPYLIIVRAGRNALTLDWSLPIDRRWDMVTLAYDEAVLQSAPGRCVGDHLLDDRDEPTKFFGIHRYVQDHPEIFVRDAVMMIDDDLLLDPCDVNDLFDLFKASGAALGQPALSWNSHYSHFVTLQNRAFLWRYTNFAEVMTPIMTGSFLRQVLPSFRANLSSWGLDYLWAALCREMGEAITVIDRVPVEHTRPVGAGGLYRSLGVDPQQELKELLAAFQISAPVGAVLGGALDPRFGAPKSDSLLESYVAGMSPAMCQMPGFIPVFQASLPHLAKALHSVSVTA